MFKSSFARDLVCDVRPSHLIQDDILPPSSQIIQDDIVDNSLSSYKSQFASEHQSFNDNYHSSFIDTDLTNELENMGLSQGGDVWKTSQFGETSQQSAQFVDRKPEFVMAVGDESVSAVGLWEGVGGSVKRDLGILQKESRLPEKTATNTRPDHFHTNLENSTFERLRQTCGDLGLDYHSQQWDCLFNLLKDERQNLPMLADARDDDKDDEDAREDDKNGDNLNLDEDKDQCSERLNDFILSLQSLPQIHKPVSLRSEGVSDPTNEGRKKNGGDLKTNGSEAERSVWIGGVGQQRVSFPWQRREAFPQHWRDTDSNQEKEIEEILDSCDKFEKEALEGEGNVRSKSIEASVERMKLEKDNANLRKELNEMKGGEKNYNELMKEVDQLHWQLNKMENSRKTYEAATKHLVTFLDQVSSSLALSSPTKSTRLGITDVSSNITDGDTGKFTRRTPIRLKSRHSMKSALGSSSMKSVSIKSALGSGSIGGFSSMTPSETSWKPPAMLINNTPACSSSPLQSLVEHQQFNHTTTTDKTRKQSILIQTSPKRSNARSVSSAADYSRLGSRPNREGWRHSGDHSHSSSMESGKDSGRASDSSSSGRSTPHKEGFSVVCGSGRSRTVESQQEQEKEGFSMVCGSGRSSRRVENRQQLAARAQRLVRSIRQLLAREKKYDVDKKGKRQRRGHLGNDAPFNTKLPGSQSPWILRPHNLTVRPVSADNGRLPTDVKSQSGRLNNTISGRHESRVELICPDTDLRPDYEIWTQVTSQDNHDDHHVTVQEVDPDAFQEEDLSPRTKILRSQSEKLIIPKSNKIPKTLRTSSFQQSTPKKPGTTVMVENWPHEESLIKINSMGVVSVPVPYPVHCHQAQHKGNILWV